MEDKKNGTFDAVSGNPSSVRKIGAFCILIATVFSGYALYKATTVTEGAAALAIIWTTIAAPVFVWMFKNKIEELKHEEVKQETSALITKLPSA
ncbi:MAG TPA: hypothetical protein VFC36_09120 [Paludibacter sp.]|nr:hypothetical protein [Paludibacter sp.]